MHAKDEINEQKLTWVNNTEYDVKIFQVIMTIVNFTCVQLKILIILTAHRSKVCDKTIKF